MGVSHFLITGTKKLDAHNLKGGELILTYCFREFSSELAALKSEMVWCRKAAQPMSARKWRESEREQREKPRIRTHSFRSMPSDPPPATRPCLWIHET